jgi:hypothetical protein
MKLLTTLLALTLLLGAGGAASAQPFAAGQIVANAARVPPQPDFPYEQLQLFSPTGAFLRSLGSPSTIYFTDFLTTPAGELLGAAGAIWRIGPDGSRSAPVPPLIGASNDAQFFTMDAAGNLYLAQTFEVEKFSPAGVRLATYPVAFAMHGIDLAADQCTLFYIAGSGIGTYNVCTAQPGVTFPSLPGAYMVRVLPDGSVLILSNGGIRRFSPSGTLLREYGAGGVFDLTPDASAAIFLSGGNIVRLDLSSGATQVLAATGEISFSGVGVIRGYRAALVAAAPVPALSTCVLVGLAAMLAMFACVRLS